MRKRGAYPSSSSSADRSRHGARPFHVVVDQAVEDNGPVWVPRTWINTLIALALAPLLWITAKSLWVTFAEATVHHQFWRTAPFWFFAVGIAIWVIFYIGLRGPVMVWLYVFGHEWTHAMFAKLSGADVLEAPVVTSRGGQVVTNKNNILISLSPYFFPFYSIFLAIIYGLLGLAFDMSPFAHKVVYTLMGFTWSFHITFTVWMVIRSQPDLEINGTFFSLVFIILVNLLMLTGLLVLTAPSVEWGSFLKVWGYHAWELIGKVTRFLGIRF